MKLPFWRTKSAASISRTKSAAPSPRIPSWATPWQGGEAPRNYEAQVRESFLSNPVASRAIRLVAEGAGGAPLVSNPPGHPALALLASAGFGASGPGLLETLAAQLAKVLDRSGETVPQSGAAQGTREIERATAHLGSA